MNEPTEADFIKIFGEAGELDKDIDNTIIGSDIYINSYFDKKTLTRKEVFDQISRWSTELLLHEHSK